MSSSRNLPIELPQDIQSQIEKIRSDNTSGAVELALRAAETLNALGENVEASLLSAYIEAAAGELIKAQPAMAPIFNLANETLLAASELGQVEEIRRAVRTSCRDFIGRLERAGQEIGKIVTDLIQDDSTIMTYSYSSTLLKALLLAKAAGKRFNVICPESRPMGEGVGLAKKLGEGGIKVSLVIDAAAFSFLPEVGMVLVGADSIFPHGLVNKIGTSGLALAAKATNTDIYALCGREKFLPPNYPLQFRESRDPTEILSEPARNVTAINYYFDLTPLEHLSAVVTEDGIMTPRELKTKLQILPLHKVFQSKA